MRPYLTLHHPASSRRYYEQGWWTHETFYSLLDRHAGRRPNAPALRDGRAAIGWAELLRRVEALAAELRALGLGPGDRVSLWLSNRSLAVVAFLACARDGLACNPSLHRTSTGAEVCTLLERLGSRVLITEPGWGADGEHFDVEQLETRLPALDRVYLADQLDADRAGAPADAPPPVDDPDKVAYLAFTSGTTGEPKCVMHSDNTLLANARDLVNDWSLGPDARLLTLSPVSHHIAWVALAQWLLAGCELVLDDAPAGMSKLDWLIESGATYAMGVPTHAMDMLAAQRERGLARLGRVEVFYMAGAPIPPSVAAAFVEQGIKPQNVYGMTENSSHQYTHPGDATETVIETCGRGGPAYEARIFDADDPDRPLPDGEVGQIGGRGAALMLGYFDDQGATESSFNRDGWFLSGDLGAFDAHGNLRVSGRVKDMIIRGGRNIYPVHIEAAALRHPAVEKAAVFGIPDARLGEKVCLAIIGGVDPDPLLTHLAREGVSRYDMPEYFLALDAFPLTASGKILKRELAAAAARGELAPSAVRYRPDG